MDKYEYQAKLEEINKLVEKQYYEDAAKIADTIEWKRVRSVRTLCMISEIYEAIGRAEDSKAILYRAYRRSPNSRQILYRLTEACVQTQEFDDAVEYYTEYVNLSPNDSSKYILKYEIYKGRGSSVEEQISVLEELKEKEYSEQWAYELARLYDEAGMTEKCVAECDDLALWFHNGKYVVQALELKKKYARLTPEQQTVYDNPSEIVDMETKEEVVEKAVPTLDKIITKELPKSEKDAIADSTIMDMEKQIAAEVQALAAESEKRPEPVKVPDTVELQSELANSMREILSGIRPGTSTEELESAPVMPPKAAPQEEEEVYGQQMSIDDLLTGAAAAQETPEAQAVPEAEAVAPISEIDDILTAPTIDFSKKIKQEIGDVSIRDYAASLKAGQQAMAGVRAPQEDDAPAALKMPEAIKMPVPQAAPEIELPKVEIPKAPEMPKITAPEAELPKVEIPKAPEMPKITAPEAELPKAEIPKAPETPQAAAPETAPVKAESTEASAPGAEEAASALAEDVKTSPEMKKAAETYTRECLDEKEKSMLGFWSHIRGMNEQINLAVTEVMKSVLSDKTSSKGNILLVGDAGNGRTTLAISLAKIISRCKGAQTAKVAKIYAEDLNSKDIAATVSKMAGGVLIIEEAGDLTENTVAQLSMAMDFKTDSLVVVLEDERRYLQDLLARSPQFAQKFTVTIHVPMLTNDELVEFGKYYADENDCTMDESAVTALYDGIAIMQSPEQPVAILDVKDIVDKAVKHVNRFGLGKLFASLSGKRYDENNCVILRGKNFKKIK